MVKQAPALANQPGRGEAGHGKCEAGNRDVKPVSPKRESACEDVVPAPATLSPPFTMSSQPAGFRIRRR
jgi:hypothetical protein